MPEPIPGPQTNAPLAELLRFVPFFAALPQESSDCFELLRRGVVERLVAGARLTAAGARPDLVFLISGEASAVGSPPRTLRPGDHYGELDLLLERPASQEVRIGATSLVYRLPGALFVELIATCHIVVRQMLVALAQRLDDVGPQPAVRRPAP